MDHKSQLNLSEYTRTQRSIEITSILVFLFISIRHILGIIKVDSHQNLFVIISAVIAGLFLADFISGVVHWSADTWGSTDWPIVGQSLIRSFREHHVDQKAITRHDFIETNGNNCLISLPILFSLYFVHLDSASKATLFFFVLTISLTSFIFLTNQFHKWSHEDKVPDIIQWLQKSHLILPKNHHDYHHVFPYTSNYCITNGWMNPLLSRVHFFPRLESMITRLTGAEPRKNDLALVEQSLKSQITG